VAWLGAGATELEPALYPHGPLTAAAVTPVAKRGLVELLDDLDQFFRLARAIRLGEGRWGDGRLWRCILREPARLVSCG
jgi:hypothetical protein